LRSRLTAAAFRLRAILRAWRVSSSTATGRPLSSWSIDCSARTATVGWRFGRFFDPHATVTLNEGGGTGDADNEAGSEDEEGSEESSDGSQQTSSSSSSAIDRSG